jgi:agmatinase
LAPPHIRAALHSHAGNSYTEELFDLKASDGLQDAGDLTLPPDERARALIRGGIAQVLQSGRRPIALGGDHSITFPILQAVHAAVGPVTILHLDAHADLYEHFDGDRYSHACPFARIMESHLATRLVQVGIRTLTPHQVAQAQRFDVTSIDMRDWTAGKRPEVSGLVYLSLDLDVLDPAYAPGLSHREPGGLSVREVLGIIQTCGGRLVGADVVELNPSQDVTDLSATVAAKCVKEIAGRMMREARAYGSGAGTTG